MAGRKQKSKYYIDNNELTAEIIECKKNDNRVSEKLGKMFLLLAQKVADGMPYQNEEDKKDCVAHAVSEMCLNFHKFDPEKGGAFALMTQQAYFGICAAWRVLYPDKYKGTISLSFLDENGKNSEIFSI